MPNKSTVPITHARLQMLAVEELGNHEKVGLALCRHLALVQPGESGMGTQGCSLQDRTLAVELGAAGYGQLQPLPLLKGQVHRKYFQKRPLGLSPVTLVYLSQDCLLPLLDTLKLCSYSVTCFCCVCVWVSSFFSV